VFVGILSISQATPIATKTLSALPPSFFARPAEQVAHELIGCLLVKRQPKGELLLGVFVETEAYSQEERAPRLPPPPSQYPPPPQSFFSQNLADRCLQSMRGSTFEAI